MSEEISGLHFLANVIALSAEGAGIGVITGTTENSAPTSLNSSALTNLETSTEVNWIGKKIAIPGAIPGESVAVELRSEDYQSSLPSARVLKIESSESSRRQPPCRYVPACGGCSLQHMTIDKQRAEKFLMGQTLMMRHAKVEPRQGYSLLGANLPEFHYRNRILLHLNPAGELGFYKSGTGDVVDIEACLLAEHSLNAILAQIRPFLPQLAKRVAAIKIERRITGHCVLLKPRIRDGDLAAELQALNQLNIPILHDQQTESDAGHFSQVNESANEILVQYVTNQIASQNPEFAITELYAGAGNFTFPIAQSGRMIQAVELDENLTTAGKLRAEELKVADKVSFITQSCERFCKFGKFTELVLLDPPRAGAKIVVEALTPKTTKFIVYVSCNPATLARDLKILTAKGYILEHIAVLDMFSQTSHVEMVATLFVSQ